jgi:hypothetical protein
LVARVADEDAGCGMEGAGYENLASFDPHFQQLATIMSSKLVWDTNRALQ